MKDSLKEKFYRLFRSDATPRIFFVGGRVNLIGEHTDYNGGYVLPIALRHGTYCVVAARTDKKIRLFSCNNSVGIAEFELDDISNSRAGAWTDYPLGVVWALNKSGYSIELGFDMLIYGTLPQGAGLSSSASIEVAVCYALSNLCGFCIPMMKIAVICQKAENEFVGMMCGVLDQFAVSMGCANCAIFLDTNSLEYEYIPFDIQGYKMIIFDTMKKRELTSSKYNERRKECEYAVECLQKELNISQLCKLTPSLFEANAYLINSKASLKRCIHAVTENNRALRAAQLLRSRDIYGFGKIMNESHVSLRDEYEVSCLELDTMWELLTKRKEVIGAKMTGAGFGGCVVAIVEADKWESMSYEVLYEYECICGYSGRCYQVDVGGKPHEIV